MNELVNVALILVGPFVIAGVLTGLGVLLPRLDARRARAYARFAEVQVEAAERDAVSAKRMVSQTPVRPAVSRKGGRP